MDDTDAGTTHTLDGDAILRLRDLDAGYGDLQILSDVDLDVADGEYVTIVGPNGAGKSTVMKTVFGLTTYMDGTVEFEGEPIHGLAPEQIIREGIGFVPQTDNVFPGLSVRENLEMGAYILDSVPEDQIEEIYDRFPILRERSGQKQGRFRAASGRWSRWGGRSCSIRIYCCCSTSPPRGSRPTLVADMFDRIDRINDSGTAVLMVEQNARKRSGAVTAATSSSTARTATPTAEKCCSATRTCGRTSSAGDRLTDSSARGTFVRRVARSVKLKTTLSKFSAHSDPAAVNAGVGVPINRSTTGSGAGTRRASAKRRFETRVVRWTAFHHRVVASDPRRTGRMSRTKWMKTTSTIGAKNTPYQPNATTPRTYVRSSRPMLSSPFETYVRPDEEVGNDVDDNKPLRGKRRPGTRVNPRL